MSVPKGVPLGLRSWPPDVTSREFGKARARGPCTVRGRVRAGDP